MFGGIQKAVLRVGNVIFNVIAQSFSCGCLDFNTFAVITVIMWATLLIGEICLRALLRCVQIGILEY